MQTIPTDFFVYSDAVFDQQAQELGRDKAYNKWTRIDLDQYRYGLSARDNFTGYHNAYSNNQHSFNRAKVVKMNLHRLPELRNHHIVVWLDGTVRITNSRASEILYEVMCHRGQNILTFQNGHRHDLSQEIDASKNNNKYATFHFHGENQPWQYVEKQYEAYLKDGYQDSFFGRARPQDPNSRFRSVFVTNFVAFNMMREESHLLLEKWWMQNLIYTTEDQIGFTYALWKLRLIPHTLPNEIEIKGHAHENTLFTHMQHNLRN